MYEMLRNGLVARIQPGHDGSRGQPRDDGDERYDEVFTRQMHLLGEAIVSAMHADCTQRDIAFVLVTQMEDLHRFAHEKGLFTLNVKEALANPRFSLPDGLKHINEAGNGVIAWEIARFLRREGLVSDAHVLSP